MICLSWEFRRFIPFSVGQGSRLLSWDLVMAVHSHHTIESFRLPVADQHSESRHAFGDHLRMVSL